MIKKRRFFTFLLSFIIVALFIGMAGYKAAKDDRLPVALKAIKTSNGWGYEIAVDGKTFIRQTTLPAVYGNIPFATEKEALLVGKHAMAKLKTGQLPQITVSELKEWGVVKAQKI